MQVNVSTVLLDSTETFFRLSFSAAVGNIAPRWIEYTFVVEINNTRRHAHRMGAQEQIE
jgi:hypothetical protein